MIESIETMKTFVKIICIFLFVAHFWRFETRKDTKSGFLMIVFAILMQ